MRLDLALLTRRSTGGAVALLFITHVQPAVVSAVAADFLDVLTDYTVTTWSQREGLPPGGVAALAQDREGYLWIGSDGGLFRFDGVGFVRWEAVAVRIRRRAFVR